MKKVEIEIFKITDKMPPSGLNVMVNYEMHYQEYWTRAYHVNSIWYVTSYNGTKELNNIGDVKEWHYLISYVD